MTLSSPSPSITAAFEDWLKAQILQLSVETLRLEAVTCTACGEVLGTYIIDYKGERFRYSIEQTYAFLKFIAEELN
jgi:hypothetical protein